MHKLIPVLSLVVVLWCGVVPAHQATELYIPVGQSPGVSNKLTDIGQIEAVDKEQRTVTVTTTTGPVAIVKGTKIYLDQSPIGLTSLQGSFADLKIGRKVEIRYLDFDSKQSADWVKIEISAP